MKKLFIAIILICSPLSLCGQEVKPLKADPTPFLGKWTATSGEYTYELTMVRDTIYGRDIDPSWDTALEQISCKIIYKRNNSIIRIIEIDEPRSMISGVLVNATYLDMRFDDTERKILGYASFKLDSNNPNKASWELTKRGLYMPREGGAEDFDIPRHLTFRKSLDLDPGKPGGGTGITNP